MRTESAAELLKIDRLRIRRSEEYDEVCLRDIQGLVEHINGHGDAEHSLTEELQPCPTIVSFETRVNRHRIRYDFRHTLAVINRRTEHHNGWIGYLRHVARHNRGDLVIPLGNEHLTIEGTHAEPALRSFEKLLQRNLVGHESVVHWRQQTLGQGIHERKLKHFLPIDLPNVLTVSPVWSGGYAVEESRFEIPHDTLIRGSEHMMCLVDHNMIELLGTELIEGVPHGLKRRKHHAGICRLLVTMKESVTHRTTENLGELALSLFQNVILVAEEKTSRFPVNAEPPLNVEGGGNGLSKTACHIGKRGLTPLFDDFSEHAQTVVLIRERNDFTYIGHCYLLVEFSMFLI